MVEAAGLPPFAVDLVRYQAEPRDPEYGRVFHARGRGLRDGDRPLPSVAFGEGRRPESATLVTLPAFDGPLALLLSLIEARQLDVLTVPLGALADAYLDALATARRRPDGQRLRVRRDREPADPDQVAGDAAAPGGRGPRPAGRRGPGPRGRAARAADPVPRLPRRRPPAARRGGRARRAVPARAWCRACRGPRRCPATGGRAAVDGPARARARRARARGAPARAAARDHPPDGHPDRARRDHPRGARWVPRWSCSRTCCAASATGSSSR